jgi:hypothetical protein
VASKGWERTWLQLEAQYPGDPRTQLDAWLRETAEHIASGDLRGCAVANAAVEIPEKEHPARQVIEESKLAQTKRLAALCAAAGLDDSEGLADELELLIEGARIRAQSVKSENLLERVLRMGQALITAHVRP